jgi:hypothetical protein
MESWMMHNMGSENRGTDSALLSIINELEKAKEEHTLTNLRGSGEALHPVDIHDTVRALKRLFICKRLTIQAKPTRS